MNSSPRVRSKPAGHQPSSSPPSGLNKSYGSYPAGIQSSDRADVGQNHPGVFPANPAGRVLLHWLFHNLDFKITQKITKPLELYWAGADVVLMLSLKLHLFPCSQLMIVTQQESSRASRGSVVEIQIVLNQPSTTAQTSRWKAQNEFTGWTSVLLLVSLLEPGTVNELLRPTCSLHFNLSSAHLHMSMNPVTYTGILLLLKTLFGSVTIYLFSKSSSVSLSLFLHHTGQTVQALSEACSISITVILTPDPLYWLM